MPHTSDHAIHNIICSSKPGLISLLIEFHKQTHIIKVADFNVPDNT